MTENIISESFGVLQPSPQNQNFSGTGAREASNNVSVSEQKPMAHHYRSDKGLNCL